MHGAHLNTANRMWTMKTWDSNERFLMLARRVWAIRLRHWQLFFQWEELSALAL